MYNGNFVSAAFFRAAMNVYRKRFEGENIVFIVVSDDIKWCKNQIRRSPKYEDVVFSGEAPLIQ